MKSKAYLRYTPEHEVVAIIRNGNKVDTFNFYDNIFTEINISETKPLKWGDYPTLIKKIKEICNDKVVFFNIYRR